MGPDVNTSVQGRQGCGTGKLHVSAGGARTLVSRTGTEICSTLPHGIRAYFSRDQILILAEPRKKKR